MGAQGASTPKNGGFRPGRAVKCALRVLSPYSYAAAYALGERIGQPGAPFYLTAAYWLLASAVFGTVSRADIEALPPKAEAARAT
jgi:hypothetical protein